jgi:hypothetical protein
MNRRKFFGFLPATAVSTAAGIAGAIAGPVRAEDVNGISISTSGHVTITNCNFTSNGERPGLSIRQAD